jgi:hypothetical protein
VRALDATHQYVVPVVEAAPSPSRVDSRQRLAIAVVALDPGARSGGLRVKLKRASAHRPAVAQRTATSLATRSRRITAVADTPTGSSESRHLSAVASA